VVATEPRPPEAPAPAGWTLLRNAWRALTSMRIALVLLFLLALGALPGALLPQRSLNQGLVDQYFTDHPTLAPLLDRLGFFDVFAAPWFAAVYLLLMISLVGCVLPRALEHAQALRAAPVAVPRNLGRLPHHAVATLDAAPDEVTEAVRTRLKGWRVAETAEGDQRGFSAEKGYLREAGNLVFHLALIGLLLGFAGGKLYGYEGQVIVQSDGGQFCNTGILGYDTFRAGLRVDGTGLAPFCVQVDDFTATYLADGQASAYAATIGYQTAEDVAAGVSTWRPFPLAVNHPLRLDGERVYLQGHGYTPRFTVTFPDGRQRTGATQWSPVDLTTMLSQGATKFQRPGVTDEAQRKATGLAITGLLAPTTSGGDVVTSVFPAPNDPQVAVEVLRGDLGLDDGRGQSIFTVDQTKVDSGALVEVARANLLPGESLRLDDGTVVRFDGVSQWVNLQVSHDPAELVTLVFAIALLGGLLCSLAVRRRRFWAKITPSRGSCAVLEIGGLARTDRAGYGEEFDRLRADLLGPSDIGPARAEPAPWPGRDEEDT
jgi:cytochrome c biogenesis protein